MSSGTSIQVELLCARFPNVSQPLVENVYQHVGGDLQAAADHLRALAGELKIGSAAAKEKSQDQNVTGKKTVLGQEAEKPSEGQSINATIDPAETLSKVDTNNRGRNFVKEVPLAKSENNKEKEIKEVPSSAKLMGGNSIPIPESSPGIQIEAKTPDAKKDAAAIAEASAKLENSMKTRDDRRENMEDKPEANKNNQDEIVPAGHLSNSLFRPANSAVALSPRQELERTQQDDRGKEDLVHQNEEGHNRKTDAFAVEAEPVNDPPVNVGDALLQPEKPTSSEEAPEGGEKEEKEANANSCPIYMDIAKVRTTTKADSQASEAAKEMPRDNAGGAKHEEDKVETHARGSGADTTYVDAVTIHQAIDQEKKREREERERTEEAAKQVQDVHVIGQNFPGEAGIANNKQGNVHKPKVKAVKREPSPPKPMNANVYITESGKAGMKIFYRGQSGILVRVVRDHPGQPDVKTGDTIISVGDVDIRNFSREMQMAIWSEHALDARGSYFPIKLIRLYDSEERSLVPQASSGLRGDSIMTINQAIKESKQDGDEEELTDAAIAVSNAGITGVKIQIRGEKGIFVEKIRSSPGQHDIKPGDFVCKIGQLDVRTIERKEDVLELWKQYAHNAKGGTFPIKLKREKKDSSSLAGSMKPKEEMKIEGGLSSEDLQPSKQSGIQFKPVLCPKCMQVSTYPPDVNRIVCPSCSTKLAVERYTSKKDRKSEDLEELGAQDKEQPPPLPPRPTREEDSTVTDNYAAKEDQNEPLLEAAADGKHEAKAELKEKTPEGFEPRGIDWTTRFGTQRFNLMPVQAQAYLQVELQPERGCYPKDEGLFLHEPVELSTRLQMRITDAHSEIVEVAVPLDHPAVTSTIARAQRKPKDMKLKKASIVFAKSKPSNSQACCVNLFTCDPVFCVCCFSYIRGISGAKRLELGSWCTMDHQEIQPTGPSDVSLADNGMKTRSQDQKMVMR